MIIQYLIYSYTKPILMRGKKNETVTLKKGGNNIQLNFGDFRKALLITREVNSKISQKIIAFLEGYVPWELINVYQIYTNVGFDKVKTKRSLSKLQKVGLISTFEADGFTYYYLERDSLDAFSRLAEELASLRK